MFWTVSQRNLISNEHVSPLDLAPSPKINSPGVALLTGGDFDSPTISHFEKFQADTVPASQSVPMNKFQFTESSDLFKSNDSGTDVNAYSNCSTPVSENKTKAQNNNNNTDKIIDVSSSNDNSVENFTKCNPIEIVRDPLSKPAAIKADNYNLEVTPETKLSFDMSSKLKDYSQCKLRLSSRPGVSEIHWGLTIKAQGPSNTSPFFIERVKIGSSADICEFQKGDILASIDGVNLGISRKNTDSISNQITKLGDLENLLAQLVLANKPITVQVFRKTDELDELNDGESDTGGDFSVESSIMKSQRTLSNISDSDSKCHEVLVSPVTVVPHKTSHDDTSMLGRSITITHSLHRSPSQSSIQISDDEVNNSSVSTNSEGKEYNYLKGNFNHSTESISTINKNEICSPLKSYQDKSKNGKVEIHSSNTLTPSDLTNRNNTSYRKQDVEVTSMEPVSFTLTTGSTLSSCIQVTEPPFSVLEDIKPTDFMNEKTRPRNFTVNKSHGQEARFARNVVGDSAPPTSTVSNETTPHPSSLHKIRHLSQQRTFHIHPKLPETWDGIPSHESGIRALSPPNYKQNSVSDAFLQSYLLHNTDLSQSKQTDSFRPHVPPRPIPKAPCTASQPSGFEFQSHQSILNSGNQIIPTKSSLSSDTTKNKFTCDLESDIYVNTSNMSSSPRPAASIPMTKTRQLPQDSLNGDKQSVTEVVNDNSFERSSVKYGLRFRGLNGYRIFKSILSFTMFCMCKMWNCARRWSIRC
ncbi:unnamed protein product [Schistosoma turkestanicum]|nr:unnamed protein product [Schistosoma turkestanicum]